MEHDEPPGTTYPTGAPYHTGLGFDEVQQEMANRIEPLVKGLQKLVLQEVRRRPRDYGITSMEMAMAQDGDIERLYTWAPRLTELGNAGVLYHDGSRRPFTDPTGRRRGGVKGLKVWKLRHRPHYDPPEETDAVKLRARIDELQHELRALQDRNVALLRKLRRRDPRQADLFD